MAANTTSSSTGSVVANVATFSINGHQGAVQFSFAFVHGDGTTVTLTPFEILIPDISATSWFTVPASDGSGSTLGAYTLTIGDTGNFLITFNYIPINAKKIRVTAAYAGGTTGTLAIDCYPDFN